MHPSLSTSKKYATRGMTLIEMLVVIAIMSIILPALYGTIVSLYKTHGATFARAVAVTEATNASRAIVRDIRASVYAEDGSLPLVSIATSSIIFFVDTDFDGRVERVRYTIQGTDIIKGVIEPTSTASYPIGSETTQTLAHDIVNNSTTTIPAFRFFSATSTEITATSSMLNIRRIEVELVSGNTTGTSTNWVRIQSSASIRNLKDSY
jgi:prepilin-type N-terminal cleavage/methylation domain-containing protein